jgi:hypothetical protein
MKEIIIALYKEIARDRVLKVRADKKKKARLDFLIGLNSEILNTLREGVKTKS